MDKEKLLNELNKLNEELVTKLVLKEIERIKRTIKYVTDVEELRQMIYRISEMKHMLDETSSCL